MTTANAPNFDLEYSEVTEKKDASESYRPAPASSESDDLPEKYRGKGVNDIIRMHQEAEKALSRQGQDLAEQRRLTDVIIELRKENAKEPKKEPPKPVSVQEVLEDPNAAIRRTLEASPIVGTVQETKDRLAQLEAELGRKAFETQYPNFMQDAQDPDFRAWVQGNPIRVELLVKADRYDFRSAEALWKMWDEHKDLVGNAQANKNKAERATRTRAAATVKGAADTAVSKDSKPIYSRAKLIALRISAEQGNMAARAKLEDPEFDRMLTQAYAEDRVR